MKLAIVTPRYGERIVGGAEGAARALGEHLVGSGHSVEVLTTCALDHLTWENELDEGIKTVRGVTVCRFRTDVPRDLRGLGIEAQLRTDPTSASPAECEEWLGCNGPVSTELLEAIAALRVDLVSFYPYLYHPIVKGVARTSLPTILHPAAHDEPALYLPIFASLFEGVGGLAFHTHAERALVNAAHATSGLPQAIVGAGIDDPSPRRRRGGEVLGVGERPYLVSVGRVDPHKGSTLLYRYFIEYKSRYPGPLALAFVGPIAARFEPHPDVVVTGSLDPQTRDDVVSDALVSVSASALESFGLVVPEAWSCGTPALVHGRCLATRELVQRAGGGLWFDSYPSFEAILARLVEDDELVSVLVANGRDYLDAHLRWPSVVARYEGLVKSVLARADRRL